VGTSSSLDLAAVSPTRWVGQGATIDVPLTVEALIAGVPQSNVVVNYKLTVGTATLSAGSATTNASGYATVSAHLANHSADVQVSACVAPNNVPCQSFTLHATPASLWILETISGSAQVIADGHSFQPLIMRVTDGSVAANAVMGVSVAFNTTVARVPPGSGSPTEGDGIVGGTGQTIILGTSSTQVATTQDGIASIVPSAGTVVGPCDLFITVNAGSATAQFHLQIVAAVGENSRNAGFVLGDRLNGLQAVVHPGTLLFAVPQGILSSDPEVDPPVSVCPESSPDDPSRDPAGSASASPAERETPVSPPCARAKPAEAKVPKKRVVRVESEGVPAAATSPVETPPPPPPSSGIPEDKRSCRVLAGDETLP
jgi:hypothetical protein